MEGPRRSSGRGQAELPQLTGESERRGPGGRFRGSPDELPLPTAPLGASVMGSLRGQGSVCVGGGAWTGSLEAEHKQASLAAWADSYAGNQQQTFLTDYELLSKQKYTMILSNDVRGALAAGASFHAPRGCPLGSWQGTCSGSGLDPM